MYILFIKCTGGRGEGSWSLCCWRFISVNIPVNLFFLSFLFTFSPLGKLGMF
jgi:hypothetical protein